ncbi:MAG: hypothetical protein K2X47_15710 [Bdellovibrionales bacterium]|nr:hypothetical protein [Bdellovibrionales bacterium]
MKTAIMLFISSIASATFASDLLPTFSCRVDQNRSAIISHNLTSGIIDIESRFNGRLSGESTHLLRPSVTKLPQSYEISNANILAIRIEKIGEGSFRATFANDLQSYTNLAGRQLSCIQE